MIEQAVQAQSAGIKKSALSEEQQAIATKAKLAGPKAIYANGEFLDLSDPVAAKAHWGTIEAKALKAGQYEGKALNWIDGGQSSMTYDKLRTDGFDHAGAKKGVADAFQKYANGVMANGTPQEQAQLQKLLANAR